MIAIGYHPKGTVGNKALLVAEETLYVGNPRHDDVPLAAAALNAGQSPVEFLGTTAKTIALKDLTEITAKENADHLTIHHGTEASLVAFPNTTSRDEAFTELENAFSLRRGTRNVSRLGAAVAPGILLAVALAVTYACSQAAADIETGREIALSGRNQAIKRLALSGLELLGPTGVSVIGGLVALAAMIWMVKRAAKPPVMVTLRR